jgi:transcriptional regulator with XRE-family HTH domain
MSTLIENQKLGKLISTIRTNKNIKLRQLAEKINLSSSLVSQIEKGHINPSLNTLRAIASALDVPLFTFFLDEFTTNDLIVKAGTGKKIMLPDKELEYTLLTPDLNGAIEMALMKLKPHSLSFHNLFAHNGEEVAYVLEGKLILYLGDKPVLLDTGDSVRIPSGIQHKWENQTNEEAMVIFAVTPPTF